jgi:hypothetical protein
MSARRLDRALQCARRRIQAPGVRAGIPRTLAPQIG